MPRRLLFALFALWAGLTPTGAIAAPEPVFPQALRVGLVPPAGMVASKRFPGFEDADRKAIIFILDLPGRAYEDLERSTFSDDQKGLTDIKRESFPFSDGIGFLMSGRALEDGVAVRKWFLLGTAFGGRVPDLATVVRFEVPEAAASIYTDAVVRAALASVAFRPAPLQERLALLPFKLDNLAGFRVMQVLPTGGVILTDGATDDITQQPYMIISAGPGAPEVAGDRDRFARNLLATAPMNNMKIQSAEAMRITGAAGYEIRARAEGLRGNPVALVQWVRFSGSGFLRIIGVTGADTWDPLFTRFRAVRDGIDFR